MRGLHLLFHSGFLFFLSFLWLPWLGLPKLYWITLSRVSIIILFLILEKMFSAFHCWEYYLLWVCHIWPLLCWGRLFYAHFMKSYYYKWVLSFVRRRQWQPTPIILPGKSHGRRSLVGCSPWGRWELGMTERLPFHFSLSCIGKGNGNPLQCSWPGESQGWGAWWAVVYGVAQSQTWLKRLSSSSRVLSKAFFAPKEIIILFLSFNLLKWCIILFDLHKLKNVCIPRKSPLDHSVWPF